MLIISVVNDNTENNCSGYPPGEIITAESLVHASTTRKMHRQDRSVFLGEEKGEIKVVVEDFFSRVQCLYVCRRRC